MATEQRLYNVTYPAADDLSGYQYRFMTVNSSGQVALTGDGEDSEGVLQNKPAAEDRAAAVAIGGISKVEVGGAVTTGNDVASDSAGRAVNAASGDYLLGTALVTATTAGEIISVHLRGKPGTL